MTRIREEEEDSIKHQFHVHSPRSHQYIDLSLLLIPKKKLWLSSSLSSPGMQWRIQGGGGDGETAPWSDREFLDKFAVFCKLCNFAIEL